MSLLLNRLKSKRDVDTAIKSTEEKVLVLRFGKEDDAVTMKLDDLLAKTTASLAKMADIYIVDTDDVPIYVQYFDITLTPATVFFFNGQHMKVDYGTPDHTKFIGTFMDKQDLIDLVEVVYRGAMKGKLIVTSPIDPMRLQKYSLLYNDI